MECEKCAKFRSRTTITTAADAEARVRFTQCRASCSRSYLLADASRLSTQSSFIAVFDALLQAHRLAPELPAVLDVTGTHVGPVAFEYVATAALPRPFGCRLVGATPGAARLAVRSGLTVLPSLLLRCDAVHAAFPDST